MQQQPPPCSPDQERPQISATINEIKIPIDTGTFPNQYCGEVLNKMHQLRSSEDSLSIITDNTRSALTESSNVSAPVDSNDTFRSNTRSSNGENECEVISLMGDDDEEDDDEPEVVHLGEIINLVDMDTSDDQSTFLDESEVDDESTVEYDDDDSISYNAPPDSFVSAEEWVCSRCTLLNPMSESFCSACSCTQLPNQINPFHGVGRNLVPIRQNNLIDVDLQDFDDDDDDVVIVNEVPPPSNAQGGRFPLIPSNAQGGRFPLIPSWPSLQAARPHTRRYIGSGGDIGGTAVNQMANADQMMQHVLSMFRRDETQMSYDELLTAFPITRRGASNASIQSLPLTTIKDVSSLPEGKQCCAICLCDYEIGDTMRMLPCLHTFHKNCVDRWLTQNTSCPMCKHEIQ